MGHLTYTDKEKEEAVLKKFKVRQKEQMEDGDFYNFCNAIDRSHLSPAKVKELFYDLKIIPPGDGYDEKEVLEWFYSLSSGEVDVPEPPELW